MCEAPCELIVLRKGATIEVQRETFETVDLVLDDAGAPLINAASLYEYQGTINVGDFDFDGHEDFAVEDSQQGPYGGPTYVVFLYDAAAAKFVRSTALSALTHESLGFFRVDAKKKHLVTLSKDGCCFHQTSTYAVVRGAPVLVGSIIEDARGDEGVVITERTLDQGKWRTTTRVAKPPR